MNIDAVIIRPVLTEKATTMAKDGVYAFETHTDASKFQIANTIETLYKVKVGQVKVAMRKGKTRRSGKKMKTVQMPDKKIAYVQLKEGTIDIFPKT